MGVLKEIITQRVPSPEYCGGDCFVVTSHSKAKRGYIRLKVKGVDKHLHRLVYLDCWGEIPEGMIVRHKCDNPSCVNPSHLEIGTHQDNMDDMTSRGRSSRVSKPGEDNPGVKITEEIVKEIRADKISTNKALATKYGVTHSNISAIRLKKTWKHI